MHKTENLWTQKNNRYHNKNSNKNLHQQPSLSNNVDVCHYYWRVQGHHSLVQVQSVKQYIKMVILKAKHEAENSIICSYRLKYIIKYNGFSKPGSQG